MEKGLTRPPNLVENCNITKRRLKTLENWGRGWRVCFVELWKVLMDSGESMWPVNVIALDITFNFTVSLIFLKACCLLLYWNISLISNAGRHNLNWLIILKHFIDTRDTYRHNLNWLIILKHFIDAWDIWRHFFSSIKPFFWWL